MVADRSHRNTCYTHTHTIHAVAVCSSILLWFYRLRNAT